jgi:hypothetical protein
MTADPVAPPSPGVGVPSPPTGPGVQPPFVTPPTDGARQRRWLAVGLAGAVALLCCVGGLVGLGGLVVFGSRMVVDQARAAVTDYLTAVQDGDYAEAYSLLCDRRQAAQNQEQFTAATEAMQPIRSFTVGAPELTEEIVVPATVRFEDGTTGSLRYVIEQDTSTGDMEVCELT